VTANADGDPAAKEHIEFQNSWSLKRGVLDAV
jgi:hypothetical protein